MLYVTLSILIKSIQSSTRLILKTLSEQANSNSMELQLKILQTILPLITNYKSIHGEDLGDALVLCYKLQDTKVPVVNNTAMATFRQLIIYVFEKLEQEDAALGGQKENDSSIRPCASDAFAIFEVFLSLMFL